MDLAVAYRVLSPRVTLLGASGAALENVIVDPMESGTLSFVLAEAAWYYLNKTSTATPAPPSIIATSRGSGAPGRWIQIATSGSPGTAGQMIYQTGSGLAGTTFLTDGLGITGLQSINGVTVVDGIRGPDLTDANTSLVVSDGTVREMPAGTLTQNRVATFSLTDALILDTVSIRRFDVSAFELLIRDSNGQPLYTFPGDGIARTADFEFDGNDFLATGVMRISVP